MLEQQSPLKRFVSEGRFNSQGSVPLVLGERPLRSLWQVAGWSDFEEQAAAFLSAQGMTFPTDYRNTLSIEGKNLWRTAPDKLLIEGCDLLLAPETGELVVLDLSHARTVVTLSGAPARTLLAQLCSVDVSSAEFKVGEFIQTGIHGISVLIQCIGPDDFEILVPRTWAVSLWELLCENAAPFAYEIASTEKAS